ncbi:MAG: ATP-binding protein [Reichenbachiella sp.]
MTSKLTKSSFLLLIVALFCFRSNLQAQSPIEKIDSLKAIIAQHSGNELIDIQNGLGWNYRNVDLDSSIHYSLLAYEGSLKSKYLLGISKSLNFLGVAERNKSNYLGALEHFFEALKYSEQDRNLTQISYTLINIGNIYIFQTNYNGATEYFEKALINAKKLDDIDLIAYCHVNLGRSKIGLKQYDKAEEHILTAIDIRERQDNKEGKVITRVDLATLYVLQEKYNKALDLLITNLVDVKKLGHTSTLAYSYLIIGETYIDINNLKEAKKYIELCIDLARKNEFKKEESDAFELLSLIQEKNGQYQQSLASFKAFIDSKHEIFNEESTRKIESLHSGYQAEKKAAETRFLKQQTELNEIIIHRQKVIMWLAIISSILFLITALIYFRSATDRKKLNIQIEAQRESAFNHNNALIDINNEKSKLIRILSHDLRAPVNNIKGLAQVLQMTHSETFTDDENSVLDHIRNESDRLINMITKILNKEALEGSSNIHDKERVNMSLVTNNIAVNFNTAAVAKNIDIITHIENPQLFILGDEVHIRQIIENLLSNAIKFSDKDKKVNIIVTEHEETIKIEVRDQGPGLTDTDKTKLFKKFEKLSAKPTDNEESTGLGLSIVKRYVDQMNGDVWYESEVGKGSSFFLEFKKV